MQLKDITIDTQVLMDTYDKQITGYNEMEVLYVGQEYGGDGRRTVVKRLRFHEKLQKILINCNVNYPDKRIYVLLEMSSQIFSNFNGISKEFIYSEEENYNHLNNVMSNLPKEN